MKHALITFGFAIVLALAQSVAAQSYSADWFKVSGGGGSSTGGVYSVSGTIGQHDAGPQSTAGNYSLQGGFWSFLALQTAGAPRLTIQLTATNTAIVSWPFPSTGWNLQQNANLANTNSWATPAEGITDDGNNKFVIVRPVAGTTVYRLFKP